MEQIIGRTGEKIKPTPKLLISLSVVYIFLSDFEIYLSGFIGPCTRYLIFIVAVLFLYYYKWNIQLTTYTKFVLLWFVFKIFSIGWSNFSNTDISRLFISQIGMVLLLCAMCGAVHDEKLPKAMVMSNYWCSFFLGILTIFFHRSYKSEVFVARQVLTLFGQQNDPNNCTAFLSIGIAIAAYSLIAEKRMKILNIVVILVNGYGIMLSGSRTGFLLMGAIILFLIFLPNKEDKISIYKFIKKIIIVLIVSVIGVWAVSKYLPAASLNRMLAFEEYSGGSGRASIWAEAWELIKQRPLFGWGWGGYYVGTGIVHNTYLTMLCDTGLVGFILFMVPIGKLLKKLTKKKYQLALVILITGVFPAISIDSINKRYFWNAIIIAIMMLETLETTGQYISVWESKEDPQKWRKKREKYLL